jgi:hypothetical protein
LVGRGDEQKGCEGGKVHGGTHSIRGERVFNVCPRDGGRHGRKRTGGTKEKL